MTDYELQPLGDYIFPSSNDLEIPDLRMDMQAVQVEAPFLAFGEQKRTTNMLNTGCLHFYVDDYRFSVIYEHPDKILKHNPRNIVEPNFSLYNEMPVAFAMQAIYKKRWIARAMQEKGIRVFVDLNVAQKYYRLNMIGVPMGWSAFCTRGYSDRIFNLEYEWRIAKEWSNGNNLIFVIYGGGILCKRFAQQHGCIYINPTLTVKKKSEALEQINNSVAFLGEEFSVTKAELEAVKGTQLEDFRSALPDLKSGIG